MCGDWKKGKQTKGSHKKIEGFNTAKPLDCIHINLTGPMEIECKGGKKCIPMIVDDFSKFIFVFLFNCFFKREI